MLELAGVRVLRSPQAVMTTLQDGRNTMRRPNAWHVAICEQLRAAGAPLAVREIWRRMAGASFRHRSKLPTSTLAARIAELVQMRKLERVGPATYQFLAEGSEPRPEISR